MTKWTIQINPPEASNGLPDYPVQLGSIEADTPVDAAGKAKRLIQSYRPHLDLDARVWVTAEDGTEAYASPPTVDEFIEPSHIDKHPKFTK